MAEPCHHCVQSDRPDDEVGRDLAVAEARCLRAGERWTTSRRRTYELLAKSPRPVKTYGRWQKNSAAEVRLNALQGLGWSR